MSDSQYTPIDKAVSGFGITSRGLAVYRFKDMWGDFAELRESVKDDRVLLCIENHQLILSRETVQVLLPFLQNFVREGNILGDQRNGAERAHSIAMEKEFPEAKEGDSQETEEDEQWM